MTLEPQGKRGRPHTGERPYYFATSLGEDEKALVERAVSRLGRQHFTRSQKTRQALIEWARGILGEEELPNDLNSIP